MHFKDLEIITTAGILINLEETKTSINTNSGATSRTETTLKFRLFKKDANLFSSQSKTSN